MQLSIALSILAFTASLPASAQVQAEKHIKHQHHEHALNDHVDLEIRDAAKVEAAVEAKINATTDSNAEPTDDSADEPEPTATVARTAAAAEPKTAAASKSDSNKQTEATSTAADADDDDGDEPTAVARLNFNINAAKKKVAKKNKSSSAKNFPTRKTKLPSAQVNGQPYLTRAHLAIARMQTFYNGPRPGQWSEGWWNSAQAYTLLADLRAREGSTFIKKITDGSNGVLSRSITTQTFRGGGLQWTDWYDDMLWWTLAAIRGADVTGNRKTLDIARNTWKRVHNQAREPPCGGLYNAMPSTQGRGQSVITTLLYVETAAMFATRYPKDKKYFLNLAKGQWKWIMSNVYQFNYIRGDGMKYDKATRTCSHNGAILSYLEGTALSAAVALNRATGDYSYIDTANNIATKSLQDLGLNRKGIAHDNCDMTLACNVDEAQFKGIFMRGLRNLYDIQPSAANGQIPGFLKANADAIWANSRNGNNLLGQRWSGPFNRAGNSGLAFSQHSSATMALVAAVGL